MDSMSSTDETGFWADVAAEELARALQAINIRFNGVRGEEDGDVYVSFGSLRGAEAFMILGMDNDRSAGSVYDRAAASCITLGEMDDDAPDELITAAQTSGWTWMIHPHMNGPVMGWHVMAVIPMSDAVTVTARLRAHVNADGGAL